MAFTGDFFCSSYKGDLMSGRARLVTAQVNHRAALYTNTASFTAATTAYTTVNEITGTNYVQDGELIVIASSMPTVTGTVAFCDFDDTTWSTATFTARGALIYDDAATTPVADATLAVLDFTSDKSASAGDFTIQWPAATTAAAILRIGP
jgi:hypothetical protein